MESYFIWPYLALMTGILLIMRFERPFRLIDAPRSDSRQHFPAIDGLRGLLAFGVFGHHAALVPAYFETGVWQTPPSNFYTMIGEVGVGLFFSVTGFLFWGKLLDTHGEPDWKRLYLGRVFRIGPVYLMVVAVMLLVVFSTTQFGLRESLSNVLLDTARWFTLGLLGQPDVNGYRDTGRLLAGVTWTLQYEWLYYFSLPLLALFAHRNRHIGFTLAGLAVCCLLLALYEWPPSFYAGLFFCGMVSASLVRCGWRIRIGSQAALVAAVICLYLLLAEFSTSLGVVQLLLMGVLFAVLSGGGVFSTVLEARPLRRLGEISYSVYLVHGLVLVGVFSVGSIRHYALSGFGQYWLIVALCGLLVVAAATLSYLFIERPGIRLGQKVGERLVRARSGSEGKRSAPV